MPDPAENATQTHTRELAAIMFSDVCNYTLIMGRDEDAGVRARAEHRDLLRSVLPKFNGRVVDEAGDGTLSRFRSAVDAVNCARHIQASLKNVTQFQVRIGIHVGDVILSGTSVIGDGVNVASRIQALASPGGICISERVYDDIRNKPDISARSLGEKTLKNVSRPIRVYEVTDSAQPTTAVLGVVKRPLVAALVVIIAGIAAIVSWKLLRPAGAPAVPREAAVNPQIRSIAVLPMENLSGDPNQEYFADGMTEELITDLAKISALRVISRTSVMQFKGERKKPLPEIAKALNVDAVVEGSVLRVGDKVRITTQLIDALADKHLWAESYERDSRDVLALQGELASAIAKQINIEVAPQERQRLKQARAVNPEAHEAYLKGRYFFSSPTVERTNKAIEQFQRAIKLDPDFALPYTGLADTYSWADDLYLSPMDVMPKAKAAAEMALHLDNSLAEAHASLGYVSYLYDYDLAASESEYKRSIELTPNYAFAHSYYGFLLSTEGRFDEAIAEGKLASDLDPLSSSIAVFASFAYMFQGKYDAARAIVQQGLDLDPTSDLTQWALGCIDMESGNFSRAIVELEKARRTEAIPYVEGWLGYAYAASGDRARALATIKELDEASAHRYVSPFSTAMIYLALGDKERALEGLEKTYAVRSQWLFLLKADKIFDPLRSEPRFQALLKKVGFNK